MVIRLVRKPDGTFKIAKREQEAGVKPSVSEPTPKIKIKLKAPQQIDGYCREKLAQGIDAYVPWYLMTSYLYYHKNESVISDTLYDEICRVLLKRWDDVTHMHKKYIKKADLTAGTCFLREHDFPVMARSAAISMFEREYLRLPHLLP